MYNPAIKEQYIEDHLLHCASKNPEAIRKGDIIFFNKIGKAEEEFDIDIARADYEVLIIMLGLLCSGSAAYQRVFLSNLKKYIDWCIINGKTQNTENSLFNTTIENIDFSQSYSQSMVKDENHLIDYLDVVLKGVNEGNVDIFNRTCFLLMWNGFTMKEIVDLKTTQFDAINHYITTNGQKILISDACFESLNILLKTKGWYFTGGFSKVRYVSKIESDFLVNNTSEKRKNINVYLMQNISKINKYYKQQMKQQIFLNCSNIIKSGIFYRMYQNELNNIPIDLSEYVKRFNSKGSIGSYESNIKIEYENWKKAFSL